MTQKTKLICFAFLFCFLPTFKNYSQSKEQLLINPFLVDINVPIDYAKVTAKDLDVYANTTLVEVTAMIATIKKQKSTTFLNVFGAMDDINNKISTTSNNCFMLYWVSTDSLIRAKGLSGYQKMDSLSTGIYSDKGLYTKMLRFKSSKSYAALKGNKKILVDEGILGFERSGVNLNDKQLLKFKKLTKEINQLSSQYSDNMNAYNEKLTIDEKAAVGLPDAFKAKFKVGESKYEIPIINATNATMMSNAAIEETRKSYFFKFNNRASDKNLGILDSLVQKRYELATILGYPSYAAYNLVPKMAKDPKTVWAFLNDLVSRSKEKAKADIKILEEEKKYQFPNEQNTQIKAWDVAFYKNEILKKQYQVDTEALRAYLPMEQCLKGMFDIYQTLLGFEFKKVENPSVWHTEVEMYEVYEGKNLKGRFYLDLYPRPNKETWFYGVGLTAGKATTKGYEIPVAMLLGNFTRPTNTSPSLLSTKELNTLFHEFGHIVNYMSYEGEFSSQSSSKADFSEAMSQLFENWLWDYDLLSSFAKHYQTGGVLPKTTFDNMLKAKNVSSGLSAISQQRSALYDMNLYDKYDPKNPISTDKLWQNIDNDLDVMKFHVEGTHYQASWIHINTHPVYYYGYLWSNVFAEDMFTEFEKNGLKDPKTGLRYRKLILANGTQRDIEEAVKEFLGRPSNNEAYIKSLGLD
jgi:thimet oligopeptidase